MLLVFLNHFLDVRLKVVQIDQRVNEPPNLTAAGARPHLVDVGSGSPLVPALDGADGICQINEESIVRFSFLTFYAGTSQQPESIPKVQASARVYIKIFHGTLLY